MNAVSKTVLLPSAFFGIYSLIIGLSSLNPVTLNATIDTPVPQRAVSWTLPAFPTQEATAEANSAPTKFNETEHIEFEQLPLHALQNLSQDSLLEYMLSFRHEKLFETDFMAMEYDLFQSVLEFEPFAALDYMVAIGHDASSEFFYSFLYSDFMVHDGKSDEVVEYINRFGPQVSLLNLIVFAEMTDQISPTIQREVLQEYILGNVDYHGIIRAAEWDQGLSQEERITAFLNTVPEFVEDPYNVIRDIVVFNSPSTFRHLIHYIEVHPDRYKLYNLIKTIPNLDLYSTVDRIMQQHNSLDLNAQVQIALIALDFGHYDALEFLLEAVRKPLILHSPINVEYAILKAISAPSYVDESLSWAQENYDALTFNPYTKKFEY